jgi:hypothetical protein
MRLYGEQTPTIVSANSAPDLSSKQVNKECEQLATYLDKHYTKTMVEITQIAHE